VALAFTGSWRSAPRSGGRAGGLVATVGAFFYALDDLPGRSAPARATGSGAALRHRLRQHVAGPAGLDLARPGERAVPGAGLGGGWRSFFADAGVFQTGRRRDALSNLGIVFTYLLAPGLPARPTAGRWPAAAVIAATVLVSASTGGAMTALCYLP
jgi:hypothetical protein